MRKIRLLKINKHENNIILTLKQHLLQKNTF